MTPGGTISAAGHAGLLLWLLMGWGLKSEPLPLEVTPVSMISGAEYAAAVVDAAWDAARRVSEGGVVREGSGPEDLSISTAHPVVPATSVAAAPVRAAEVVTASVPAASHSVVAARSVASTVEAERVEVPPTTMPEPRPETSAVPAEAISAPPVQPVAVAPAAMPVVPATTSVATTATVEALPESNDATAVAEALRPPTRPTDLGAEPEPVAAADPEPRPVEEAPPSAPAETETVRGRADGTREVEATQAGPGAAATAAAQQAAATYPAEVMQRLSRTRRDRLRVSGTAVIAFTVGDNGSLVALVVAQGSGSEEVDRAGLALVQRAAPFPPPPPGAQRNFSFQFTGN